MNELSIDLDALAALGAQLPRRLAPVSVLKCLDSCASSPGESAILACSGGADSVALTAWMWWHFAALRGSGRLQLVHVHHGLRVSAADHDARFVEELGRVFGFPTTVCRFQAVRNASEAVLRKERHRLLRETAERVGASIILFGHQADDVFENLLFRLARGSSIAGLAGLRPVQQIPGCPLHLRPLLRTSRMRIHGALRAAGVPWREDASNQSASYTRNQLRQAVVPTMESVFEDRDLRQSAAAVHRQLGELDALVESLAEAWLSANAPDRKRLPREPLVAESMAVQRRILEKWARAVSGLEKASRARIDEMLDALTTGNEETWPLAKDCCARLDGECLHGRVANRAERTPWTQETLVLRIGTKMILPDGAVLKAERVTLEAPQLASVCGGSVDPAHEAFLADESGTLFTLRVRAWQPGDSFRTLGAPGSRKVQDCFTDRGVPPDMRRRLPLVCSEDGEILWIPGFPPAESRRLGASNGQALWLTYYHA